MEINYKSPYDGVEDTYISKLLKDLCQDYYLQKQLFKETFSSSFYSESSRMVGINSVKYKGEVSTILNSYKNRFVSYDSKAGKVYYIIEGYITRVGNLSEEENAYAVIKYWISNIHQCAEEGIDIRHIKFDLKKNRTISKTLLSDRKKLRNTIGTINRKFHLKTKESFLKVIDNKLYFWVPIKIQ